ncbi:MAG: ComEC/Rec2 family competence protein [Planctomycetaceae bacterium]|nr:ComEC/Rec2 family competence protein [Planctomycetaceae bacterium]
MTSREPLPVCLAALCLGIVGDKGLGVPAFLWGTLFLILAGVWVWYNWNALRWDGLKSKPAVFKRDEVITNQRLFRSAMMLLGLVAVFGGLWHHWYWNVYPPGDPGLFQLDEPTPVVMEGKVISFPRWIPAPPDNPGRFMPPTDQTVLTLRAARLRNGRDWEPACGRVYVSVTGKLPDVRYGDSLRIIGKLSHPNRQHNPGDYDQATSLRQQRILSMLRVNDGDSVRKLQSGSLSVARLLEQIRDSARANIARSMTPEHAGFAAATILGVRDEIEPELSQLLIESGTAHILAISGLHVGLVALGFVFLLRLLGLRRKTFAIALTLTILCYLCITDMRPSAIRASLLVFVACLSIFRGQRRLQINAFAATGIIVLILNPTNLFQVGVQLSFLATSVFLWFNQRLDLFGMFFERNKTRNMSSIQDKEKALDEMADDEKLLAKRYWGRMLLGFAWRGSCKMFNGLINGILVCAVIWLVVSPLIASQMHVFSMIGLMVNPLLWIPLTLALLSGFCVVITGWICPPMAVVFGWCANASYALLANTIAWFHRMPGGYAWVPGFHGWWLIGLYVPFLLLSLFPQLRPKKRWLVIAPACWLLVAFAVHYVRQWDDWRNDRLYVRVLSVGHGMCVHVKTPNGKSIFYDVGSMSSPFKGANIAAHSLWDFGCRKIDAVIISHPDSDHYNGLALLLEKFRVETVYVNQSMFQKEGRAIDALHNALTSRNIPVMTLASGDVINQPGFPAMSVLHPPVPDEILRSICPDSDHGMKQPGGIEEEETLIGFDNTDSNANSLVLLIEHRGHRILLPGDLESKLTPEFMLKLPVHVDVMLSPHHGSIKKTSDELVAWATPEHLVISGGLFTYNPNSKPHFEESGCRVFETLKNGMVEVIIDRQGIRVRSRW